MFPFLALYVLALAGLSAAAAVPSLGFLSPLSLAVLLFGSIGLWRMENRPFRELGFPKSARWPLQLLISFGVGIVIVLVLVGILLLTGLVDVEPKESAEISIRQIVQFALIVPALIAASEEIVFRGCYFRVIGRRYILMVGILASATLWAFTHVPAMAGDGVSPLGIVFGMATFISWGTALSLSFLIYGRSLWVPIGLHYGYNLAFSLLGALFLTDVLGAPLLTGSSGWVPETGVIGFVAWAGLALLALWLARRRSVLS